MKITELALKVTKCEGKKIQVNIAQVLEILRVINKITHGAFYSLIRKI